MSNAAIDTLADTQPAPEPGKRHLKVLTISEIRSFKLCPQKHFFRYGLRRRPVQDAQTLRFGTLWHVGMQAFWECAGAPSDRLEAMLMALRAQDGVDPFDLVILEELSLGYVAIWGENPDEQYETIAAEIEFRSPIVNPKTGAASRTYEQGGKIDVLARSKKTGRVVVVECKTTSEDISLGASYWRLVSAVNPQLSTYLQGARSLGHDPAECVFDVCRKPTIRPLLATPVESRKYTAKGLLYAAQRENDETPEDFRLRLREKIAEDPERYYSRGHVVRLEEDEAKFRWSLWQTAQLMRECANDDVHPQSEDACRSYHRDCEYLSCCSGEASIDDDNLFRTAAGQHEELGGGRA